MNNHRHLHLIAIKPAKSSREYKAVYLPIPWRFARKQKKLSRSTFLSYLKLYGIILPLVLRMYKYVYRLFIEISLHMN